MSPIQPPIILDIEASGFGVGSYPIEIGYIDADGHTWYALVQPQDQWLHWDAEAEKLHQQTRQDLLEHGLPAKQIAQHLNKVFFNQHVYTDGWFNDFVWLNCLYEAADMCPHFKLEDLRLTLSEHQQNIWHERKQAVIDQLALDRHRASTDARVLQLTWIQTLEATPALA